MLTAVIGLVVFAFIVSLIVIVARDPGPAPEDVAVAYEGAWDRLDFEALWSLSGDELRDGMHRKAFVAAKRAAYSAQADLGGLAAEVRVERLEVGKQVAVAFTEVHLRDGSTAHNEVQLEHRAGKWVVVAYRLLHSDAAPNAG